MSTSAPDRYEDRTSTYTPLEHLVLQVLQAEHGAYCDWVPAWADQMYGARARRIADTLSRQFEVKKIEP